MAQCKQTASEFIKDAFSPMVAVLCSHDAELVCQKNNLSFVELIQPFCRLNVEAHIRDPGNIPHTIRNMKVCIKDMNSNPPQATLAKKLMNEAVINALPNNADISRNNVVSVGSYDLQLSSSTPWYEAFRDSFLSVAYPSDHEFVRHYLACIFVVSSAHADAMDQFSRLTQQQHLQQHQQPHKLPKWFCPNILRYYVLIHDVTEVKGQKPETIYQSMKSTYGVHSCHLLQVNSRIPHFDDGGEGGQSDEGALPDPWSQYISHKQDGESAELDTGQSMMVDTSGFPGHVTEGGTNSNEENIESGVEVTEESVGPVQQSSIIIDHPLAPDSVGDMHSTDPADGFVDNLCLRDSQNNPVGSTAPEKNWNMQYGTCLSLSDHDRLRIFIQEFMTRGLIPWAERYTRNLNEQVMTRKGLHKSIFSATKKWFGGNKPTGQAAIMEKTNVVYTPEAPEMQMRRLADLAFMFQLYEMAYQIYHSAKRDFNNDHAWLHYAGTLEMACMAVFLQNSGGTSGQRQYPQHYMESAVSTYLTSCRSPHFATRATLLSTEALKSKNMYAEAANQFIKMTSEKDSDLRSALLLEQAAHCFIQMKTPMVRKYSFHMILAGHRFSKAGQRRHALRSYGQALQVYKGKNWTLAEDHINFTIGRQSFNLKHLDNATAAFKHLLGFDSQQSPLQQNAFLREYLYVYKQQLNHASPEGSSPTGELPQLPLPTVNGNSIKVLCSCLPPSIKDGKVPASGVDFSLDDSCAATWDKLEELVVVDELGAIPAGYRYCTQCYTENTNNAASPMAVMDEPVYIEVLLGNPLKVSLVLTDIVLLWRFLPACEEGQEKPQLVSNETDMLKNTLNETLVESPRIEELVIEPNSSQKVQLCVVPHHQGELQVSGLAYNLGPSPTDNQQSNSIQSEGPLTMPAYTPTSKASFINNITVRGMVNLEVQGQRLNNTITEKAGKFYGTDRRLDLLIVPHMPNLQVFFSDFPLSLLCGEVRHLVVEFRNDGQLPLVDLSVACSEPEQFMLCGDQCDVQENVYQTITNTSDSDSEEFLRPSQKITFVQKVVLPGGQLRTGESVQLPMWIRGAVVPGIHTMHFLFVYKSMESQHKVKRRVLRHTAEIIVQPSLGVSAVVMRSEAGTQHKSSQKDQASDFKLKNLQACVAVENLNNVKDSTITEFSILQVSCASCQWHLQHLSTHRHSDIKISSHEKVQMCFKVSRCKQSLGNPKGVIFTNVTFDQHQLDSAATPCSDFYFRSLFKTKFDEVDPDPPKNPNLPPPPPEGSEVRLPFADLDHAVDVTLTLIVLWKAFLVDESGVSHMIVGQHHVTVNHLNETVALPLATKLPLEQTPIKIIRVHVEPSEPMPNEDTTKQLVKFCLVHPKSIIHPFNTKRMCKVRVEVQVYNCSTTPLHVEICTAPLRTSSAPTSSTDGEKPSTTAPPTSALYQNQPSAPFTWLGHSKLTFELPPATTHSRTLTACLPGPGTYNLSTLRVAAAPTVPLHGVAIPMTTQTVHSVSMITVAMAASPEVIDKKDGT